MSLSHCLRLSAGSQSLVRGGRGREGEGRAGEEGRGEGKADGRGREGARTVVTVMHL